MQASCILPCVRWIAQDALARGKQWKTRPSSVERPNRLSSSCSFDSGFYKQIKKWREKKKDFSIDVGGWMGGFDHKEAIVKINLISTRLSSSAPLLSFELRTYVRPPSYCSALSSWLPLFLALVRPPNTRDLLAQILCCPFISSPPFPSQSIGHPSSNQIWPSNVLFSSRFWVQLWSLVFMVLLRLLTRPFFFNRKNRNLGIWYGDWNRLF